MNELRKITKKEILFKDNYISYTKSMIHVPIFCMTNAKSSTADDLYTLKFDKYEGFRKIRFRFPLLSIKTDFMVFSFIIKLFYENCEKGAENPHLIDFEMNDFFDYFKIVRNNRSSFAKTIDNSVEKLAEIKLTFERGDTKYFCNFINHATMTRDKKRSYHFELQKEFLNFFKHDADLIFNINIENYMMLEKEFSKILYLYYITNLHKAGKDNTASFDKDLIFMRLQSASADRRKLQLIREANEELKNLKLIENHSVTKSGNRITKINIRFITKKKDDGEKEVVRKETPAEITKKLRGSLFDVLEKEEE